MSGVQLSALSAPAGAVLAAALAAIAVGAGAAELAGTTLLLPGGAVGALPLGLATLVATVLLLTDALFAEAQEAMSHFLTSFEVMRQ